MTTHRLFDGKLGLGIGRRTYIHRRHFDLDLCLRARHGIQGHRLFPLPDVLTRIQLPALLIQRELPVPVWKTKSLTPQLDPVLHVRVANNSVLDIKADLTPRRKALLGSAPPIARPDIKDLHNDRIAVTACTVDAHGMRPDGVKLLWAVTLFAMPYLDRIGMWDGVIMTIITGIRVVDGPPGIMMGVGSR